MPHDEDRLALIRAAGGEEEAFAEVFHRHFASAYNFALWVSNDPGEAEDLTQEAFWRAHRNLGKFGPPWNIRAWLFRTIRNLRIDRSRRERPAVHLEASHSVPDGGPSPERQALTREIQDRVRVTLFQLPPVHREALVLREMEGLPYADVASVMGITLDHVKVTLHRARAKFKEAYAIGLLVEDLLPKCPVLGDLLDAVHDGEPLGAEADRIRQHIRSCDSCQQRTRELVALSGVLSALPMIPPPPQLAARILRKALGDPPPPRAPSRFLRFALGGGMTVLAMALGYFFLRPRGSLPAAPPPSATGSLSTPTVHRSPTITPFSTSAVLFSSATPPGPAEAPTASPSAFRPPLPTTPAAPPPATPTPDAQGPSIKAMADSPDPIKVSQPKGCSPTTSTVSAAINDPSGVQSAYVLFFHTTIGQVPMSHGGGNTWKATLGPYGGIGDGTVDYQIHATDARGNANDSAFGQITVLSCLP